MSNTTTNWAYDKEANEIQYRTGKAHRRRKNAIKYTHEEVAEATKNFLKSGGRIDYLEPSEIPLHLCNYEIFV